MGFFEIEIIFYSHIKLHNPFLNSSLSLSLQFSFLFRYNQRLLQILCSSIFKYTSIVTWSNPNWNSGKYIVFVIALSYVTVLTPTTNLIDIDSFTSCTLCASVCTETISFEDFIVKLSEMIHWKFQCSSTLKTNYYLEIRAPIFVNTDSFLI